MCAPTVSGATCKLETLLQHSASRSLVVLEQCAVHKQVVVHEQVVERVRIARLVPQISVFAVGLVSSCIVQPIPSPCLSLFAIIGIRTGNPRGFLWGFR